MKESVIYQDILEQGNKQGEQRLISRCKVMAILIRYELMKFCTKSAIAIHASHPKGLYSV